MLNFEQKIKVCGMREAENLREIAALEPDFLGLIFYPKSPRFVSIERAEKLPEFENIRRVGVFVNETLENILRIAERTKLSFAQLHGDETPQFCGDLQKQSLKIIKVFKVDESFDSQQLKDFESACDYFLFDTKTANYGGSGNKFDWGILRKMEIKKPFFLGGGIGAENFVEAIEACRDLPLFAIDINSQAEISPGVKSAQIIREILEKLNAEGAKRAE